METEIEGTELTLDIGTLPAAKGIRALLTEMFETLPRIALDAGATSKPAKIRLSEAKASDGDGAVAIQMRCPAHDVMPESVGASGRASGASARTSATDFGLEFCKRVAACTAGCCRSATRARRIWL